jgi:hypothetical protein
VSSTTATIRFEAVGRAKRTWTHRFLALPEGEAGEELIAQQARSALMSRDVVAVWDETGKRGLIFAGAHRVGSFVLVASDPPSRQEALWL